MFEWQESVGGSLPVRGPHQHSSWRRETAAVLFSSLRRARVLDFHLFPKGTRKAPKLESVSYHLSPNTQTPFRICDATLEQNSLLVHFLVPLPACSLRRESFQNKFRALASLRLALQKSSLICKITLLKLSEGPLQF